jgi:hypothetical protein
MRKKGTDVLDRLLFKNCNETVKQIIGFFVDYMQGIPEMTWEHQESEA